MAHDRSIEQAPAKLISGQSMAKAIGAMEQGKLTHLLMCFDYLEFPDMQKAMLKPDQEDKIRMVHTDELDTFWPRRGGLLAPRGDTVLVPRGDAMIRWCLARGI